MRTAARRWIAKHKRLVALVAMVALLAALLALTSLHTFAWNVVARHCGSITVWDDGIDHAVRAEDSTAKPAVSCLADAFLGCTPAGLQVRERGIDWAFTRLWVVEPRVGGCSISAGSLALISYTWSFTCQSLQWSTESVGFPGSSPPAYTADGVLLTGCDGHADVFVPVTIPPGLADSSGETRSSRL